MVGGRELVDQLVARRSASEVPIESYAEAQAPPPPSPVTPPRASVLDPAPTAQESLRDDTLEATRAHLDLHRNV
jgi:hypothetical protein